MNSGRQNSVQISEVSNEIPDQDLEENIVKICKDLDINVSHIEIEGCHGLPLGRNTINITKQVTALFYKKFNQSFIDQTVNLRNLLY